MDLGCKFLVVLESLSVSIFLIYHIAVVCHPNRPYVVASTALGKVFWLFLVHKGLSC